MSGFKKKVVTEAMNLEMLQQNVPKKYKKLVDQETVDNLNKLVDDPDYGEEFKESILTHTKILEGTEKWSMQKYIEGVKFYSLTASGHSQVEAYIKVFPNRLQARLERGQSKSDMNGEAARFNATDIVNKIRQQALVPLHLVNQGNLQLGINVLVEVATRGRSEVARVTAALGLLKELRPPETQQVELQVGLNDEARAAQERQNTQLLDIAQNQRRLLEAGMDLNDIQSIHVKKEEVIEVEVD